ncbi:hypothetical protein CLG96_13395 [Sphingomonas oleivorans]|uniref:Transcription factor zinc-finger domain-containing protein n=2 Tax=Sphingomonas oleivorans TaxID=1735121 RepID=A0A2T5FWF8_9SPHN|nr:hypothetical protein CLG96_13395 [Sphingomonas oleivorans]
MSCPVCAVPLVMSERQGIEIDYCPQCRGVWLDRGELDKIIDRSQHQSAPPQPAGHAAGGYGHAPYGGYSQPAGYKKRKKSFLEELFD